VTNKKVGSQIGKGKGEQLFTCVGSWGSPLFSGERGGAQKVAEEKKIVLIKKITVLANVNADKQ